MLTRRKLLIGGAAQGIIAPTLAHRANAAWSSFAASSTPQVFPPALIGPSRDHSILGQIKPLGVPSINWNHPLATGLMFYGFDLGNGTYINLCPGHHMRYTDIQLANAANDFGAMTLFPGLTLQSGGIQPGPGAYADVKPQVDIVTALTLQNQGIGAGATFACCCYRLAGTVSADFEWIFGSTGVSAGEGSIPCSFAFVEAIPPNGNYEVGCYVLNNAAGTQGNESQFKVSNSYTITPGQFTSFLCSIVNTSASPGTGTANFYAQGELAGAPSTGISMWQYNPINVAETEIMFGGNIHTDTTQFHHAFGGFVPCGAVWKRPLSPSEAKWWHLNPYCMLQ